MALGYPRKAQQVRGGTACRQAHAIARNAGLREQVTRNGWRQWHRFGRGVSSCAGRMVVIFATVTAATLPSGSLKAGISDEPGLAPPTFLTKEDICQGAEAACSAIEDLTVSFCFNFVNPPARNLHARSHKTVAVKGEKTYLDHEYGAAPQDGERRTFRTEAAYNGKRSTYHVVEQRRAYVGIKRMRETETQGSGFFDIMLLNVPRPELASAGGADQSLVSLLRCEHSQLRGSTEIISGRRCHVMDLIDPRSKQVSMTAWIDCERGFLPLKQVYYGGPDHKDVMMEFSIDEVSEPAPGLWFPVLGRKKIYPIAGMTPFQETLELVLEVDGWREGRPALAVNSGLEDEFFDLWKRLPPGTVVMDLDVQVYWTVGGKDYEALADYFQSIVADRDLAIPERAGSIPPSDPCRPPAAASVGRDATDGNVWGRKFHSCRPGIALAVAALALLTVAAAATMTAHARRHRHV